jgi:hypothetical protein
MMQTDEPLRSILRPLAQDIALGGSAGAWARINDLDAAVVTGWTEGPTFRELVENCRLDHSERLVGKIAKYADRAIDRLVEFSENNDQPSVGLSATKAIIEKWVSLSVFFVQEQKYQSLGARVDALLEARKAGSKTALAVRS